MQTAQAIDRDAPLETRPFASDPLASISLKGQTALVTGASRGIGAAIVRELAARGARVVGWDKSPEPDPGLPAETWQVDVADPAALRSARDRLLAAHDRLHILVNNAGIQGPTLPTDAYPDEAWAQIIGINLTAVFSLCKLFGAHMAARGGGRIVNMSSVAGLRGAAQAPAYSASKAGVVGLTLALAKEWAASGVTVNAVAPGMIETDLLQQMSPEYIQEVSKKIPMGRLGMPQEVAALVGWIASPASSFVTGSVFDVSGGRLNY